MASSDDTGHSFGAYFKRATSPLVVLALLSEKSMYAYELSSEMEKRSNGKFTISVIYPVLYRLEKLNYIASASTEVIDGRARIYYKITPSGKEYLITCLGEFDEFSKVFNHLTEEIK